MAWSSVKVLPFSSRRRRSVVLGAEDELLQQAGLLAVYAASRGKIGLCGQVAQVAKPIVKAFVRALDSQLEPLPPYVDIASGVAALLQGVDDHVRVEELGCR